MFQQINSQNIYEEGVHYENDQGRISFDAVATSRENDQNTKKEPTKMHDENLKTEMQDVANFMKKTRTQIRISFATALVVLLSLLVVLIVHHLKSVGSKTMLLSGGVNNESQIENQTAKSCYDLKQNQLYTNGVYLIKPEDDVQQIEVFCDMETDEGGWTLVASIHENDIGMKCDVEDRWSKYVPVNRAAVEGKTNWENDLLFGNVLQCTQSDYKNSAYYAMSASDIMIWHVPSHTKIAELKSRAKLRYRTTNQFLQETGGNLKNLFNERYPLKVKFENFIGEKRNDMIMSALVEKIATIRAILPDWYSYDYSTHDSNYLRNSPLYSFLGNRIDFGTTSESHGYLNYERRYKFARPKFVVDTKKSQPFILVAAISNKDEVSQRFWIKITGYRFETDTIEILKNNLTLDGIFLEYRVLQFSNPQDPTVCEFHFIIYSTEKWRSTPPSSFKRENDFSSTRYRYNQFGADGTPSNIVMGYMLLTRSNGSKVSKEQADKIGFIILQEISSLKELFNEKDTGGLVVPVTFDKGNINIVLETVPPYLRESVEPGYVQFRAYNETGYPNAFCPGIKMNIMASELGCVGGISDDFRDSGTCGDFAGWAGGKTDIIQQNKASGRAHSQNDISTAILIFYR